MTRIGSISVREFDGKYFWSGSYADFCAWPSEDNRWKASAREVGGREWEPEIPLESLGDRVFHAVLMAVSRQLAKGEPLKMAEGDAIARLARVSNAARRIFGDAEFAEEWLNTANPALRDQVPIEMAATDAGAREVETVLSRIAYGDYS